MDSDRLVMACDAPELALLKQGMTRFGELEVEIQRVPPRERHKKMAESLGFDICEYSLVDYLSGFARGLGFTAIPVFPHRIFRHRDIWVSTASGIKEPKELSGQRIGIQSWTNSASVWQRGLLAQDFGVDLKSIEWVAELHQEGERGKGPQWARINGKPKERSLDQMLASGDIDAMMLPRLPELSPEELTRIRRLFPDYVAAEQDYRARTGIFPIMHVMVIKNGLLSSYPGIAKMISHGVQAAVDTFVDRKRLTGGKSILWPDLSWAEQERHLGPHAWPAGVEANQKELDALIGYAVEQGILSKRILPEELFQGKA
jgi:4,5-dihydroxyphthalate decarboxylase